MNQKHPTEEELDAAYRQASNAEAGRPAAYTRAAILAEAEAAARRRTPAANEPRYFWRAVAGLAVMGVAVLIWRQTDEPMPGDAPQVTAVEERAMSGSATAEQGTTPGSVAAESQVMSERVVSDDLQASSGMVSADSQAMPERATADSQAMMSESVTADSRAPVAQGAASPAAPPPAAPARESRTAQKAADASVAVSDRGGQVVAEATPSRETREATAARSAPAAPPRAAQSAVLAQQVREVAPRAPATLPEEEFLRLLRARFPTEFQSTQFHRLWLVRDADGQVLLTGQLEPEQQLHDLDEQLGRGLAGRTPGPWQVRQLQNAAGQRIELAIAEVELGEPRR